MGPVGTSTSVISRITVSTKYLMYVINVWTPRVQMFCWPHPLSCWTPSVLLNTLWWWAWTFPGVLKTRHLSSPNTRYLLTGCQSTTARRREPRSCSSSWGGGLSRRYAVGEDPKCTGRHCPVAAPHPQWSTEPAVSGGLVITAAPSCYLFVFTPSVRMHPWRKYKILSWNVPLLHHSIGVSGIFGTYF